MCSGRGLWSTSLSGTIPSEFGSLTALEAMCVYWAVHDTPQHEGNVDQLWEGKGSAEQIHRRLDDRRGRVSAVAHEYSCLRFIVCSTLGMWLAD